MPQTGPSPFHKPALGALLPAAAPTAVLILGRLWSTHGAAHSVGDAVLAGGLSLGAAAIGIAATGGRNGDAATARTCFALAGGLAGLAVCGYAAAVYLPLGLWALATTVAAALARRALRQDTRDVTAHERARELAADKHASRLAIEQVRADAVLGVADRYAHALTQQSAAEAWAARQFAARYGAPDQYPYALASAERPALTATPNEASNTRHDRLEETA